MKVKVIEHYEEKIVGINVNSLNLFNIKKVLDFFLSPLVKTCVSSEPNYGGFYWRQHECENIEIQQWRNEVDFFLMSLDN